MTLPPLQPIGKAPGANAADKAEQDWAKISDPQLLVTLADLMRTVALGVPGCDGASISLLRGGEPCTFAVSHQHILAFDEAQYRRRSGPCVMAMHEGVEIAVDDYGTDRRWPEVERDLREGRVRSSLSLPLSDDGQVIGGLNLYAHRPRSFTDASRETAEAFGRQVTVLLGYLRQLHAERDARIHERELSAVLQRSLLPTLPDLPGISSAARYLVSSAHAHVGGDWYDLFALPDGVIGLAIGDVMGHDLAAAAAMGQLRGVLRSYAYEGASPSVVLDRLDTLVQEFEMAQLVTAIYGRLILDGGPESTSAMLLFTNAGHPPPLLRTPDGTVTVLQHAAAPLIGAVPPELASRGEGAVLMPTGSLLLLYTDGLVETRADDFDMRIDELARAVADLDPQATPDQVCDSLITTMSRDEQHDDVALLAVRIGPASPVL